MKRLFSALLALIVLLAAQLHTPLAFACSAGPEFDPLVEAEVIVGGRVAGWEAVPNASSSAFIPIRVDLAIDWPVKGEVGSAVSFLDRGSLMPSNNQWAGASGACGVFDSDPTGSYLVLGLDRAPDGTLMASRPMLFFIGPEPSGPAFDVVTVRLAGEPVHVEASPTVARATATVAPGVTATTLPAATAIVAHAPVVPAAPTNVLVRWMMPTAVTLVLVAGIATVLVGRRTR